jgi:dienelactone hydrolase
VADPLAGFSLGRFEAGGRSYPVYRRGSGPGVLVMHEIPGIAPEVARFATWVADAGFSVALPSMFGTPGKPLNGPYALCEFARTCISREFAVLAANRSSPITDWLRALGRALHAEVGGRGVGAVGMCLTGNFALALMLEPAFLAPVLAQPSLPIPIGRERRRGLHVSPEELACARRRAAEGAGPLALRFDADPLCPVERFQRLREEFGRTIETIEIPSRFGRRPGAKAHCTLTHDLIDQPGHPTAQARDRVITFLRHRLLAEPSPP